MHKRHAALVLMMSLVVSCSSSRTEPVDRMIDLGSHSLHAVVTGEGSPAVVFDGGIGALCEEYRQLQDRIAAATTVVTYDRAGYGSSEVGPLPRDSRREVEELRAMLARLDIPRPYILVGHSLGGLNVQVYAGLHPEEVAGMVLLDPPPLSFILGTEYTDLASMAAQMTDEWQGIADRGLQSDDEAQRAEAGLYQMLASEHREMFTSSSQQASSIASFGAIPLVVVASGVPNPVFGDVAEPYQLYWAAQSEALSAKSSQGRFVLAETSTHRLHDDAADLVSDIVLSMVSSLRETTGSDASRNPTVFLPRKIDDLVTWKHRTRFAPQLKRTGGCTCVQVADALGRSRRKAQRFGCREKDLARWTRQIGAKLLAVAGPPLTLAGLNQLFDGEIDTDALEVFANNVLSVRLPPPTPYCCATHFCYCYGGLDCLGMTLVPLLCDSSVHRDVDSNGVCSKGGTFTSCSYPDCWCPEEALAQGQRESSHARRTFVQPLHWSGRERRAAQFISVTRHNDR